MTIHARLAVLTSALLVGALAFLWHNGCSGDSNNAPTSSGSSLMQIEAILNEQWADRWPRVRTRLLATGVTSEAQLKKTVDASRLTPWATAREQVLDAVAGSGLDVPKDLTVLGVFALEGIDAGTAGQALGLDASLLDDRSRLTIAACVESYREEISPLIQLFAEELRSSWYEV